MSKQKYEKPEMQVIKFETQDIITTSTGEFDGEWVPLGGRLSEDELDH